METTRKQHRVHILSEDGVGIHTQCIDADTGEEIKRVYRIDLSLDMRDRDHPFWQAQIYTHTPRIDILARADVLSTCPYCKQEFRDGEEA